MSEQATAGYPVQVSVESPGRFQRVHVLLRIGIWIVLGWLSNVGLGFVFLAGPVVTAVLVAQGGDGFHTRYGETYRKVVSFWTGLQGYLFFGTDTFPSWGQEGPVRYSYRPTGTPTVGSALLRLIMVIPHAIVLFVVGILAALAGLAALVTILVDESVPMGLWKFLMGVVAWQARVFSYFLSMVEEYPPFSLDVEVRGA